MPSDVWIAKHVPALAITGTLGCMLVVALLRWWFLPGRVILWVGIPLLAIVSLTYLYKGVFMIRYPGTAVEERIRPQVFAKYYLRMGPPDSTVGAVLKGLFVVLHAASGLLISVVFATFVL